MEALILDQTARAAGAGAVTERPIRRKPPIFGGFLLETAGRLFYVWQMKGLGFTLFLLLIAGSAEAQIYKWILPDGSVEYSDRPPAGGAKKVELSPLITYSSPPLAAEPADTAKQSADAIDGYDSFQIASPANDAAIRDNAGEITINFAVTPTLVQGHAIDIFVDGRKFGRSKAPLVTLLNVSRGTHQIYATIVDDTGAELARTGTVTVHLQRASVAGTALGGARSPGGPATPGGPENPGGPGSPGGPASPGGPKSGGGATP